MVSFLIDNEIWSFESDFGGLSLFSKSNISFTIGFKYSNDIGFLFSSFFISKILSFFSSLSFILLLFILILFLLLLLLFVIIKEAEFVFDTTNGCSIFSFEDDFIDKILVFIELLFITISLLSIFLYIIN